MAIGITSLELTKTFGGVLAFEHYWTPSLRTAWVAGYLEVEYNDAAKTLIANLGRRCAGRWRPLIPQLWRTTQRQLRS